MSRDGSSTAITSPCRLRAFVIGRLGPDASWPPPQFYTQDGSKKQGTKEGDGSSYPRWVLATLELHPVVLHVLRSVVFRTTRPRPLVEFLHSLMMQLPSSAKGCGKLVYAKALPTAPKAEDSMQMIAPQ